MSTPTDPISLADWRRAVAVMYAQVRGMAKNDPEQAWESFRTYRDQLFKTHPQSPLSEEQREKFKSLAYFPYDPDWRLIGKLDSGGRGSTRKVDLGGDGLFRYSPIGVLHLQTPAGGATLDLFWVEGYGGGLFLPFLDASNRVSTFGGGRYLLDTIKGADLGADGDEPVLDFNFAYNPSCAYNPRWVCPLAPPGNRFPFEVPAGELYEQIGGSFKL